MVFLWQPIYLEVDWFDAGFSVDAKATETVRCFECIDQLHSWCGFIHLNCEQYKVLNIDLILNDEPAFYSCPAFTREMKQILYLQKSVEIRMEKLIKETSSMVSFTNNTWSLRVYCGYLSPTMHSVDWNWVFRPVLLEFERFFIHQNASKTSTMPFELISQWKLPHKVKSITVDYGSKMC